MQEKDTPVLVVECKIEESFKEIFNRVCETVKTNFINDGFVPFIVYGLCHDKVFIIPLDFESEYEKITEFGMIESLLKKNRCYAYICVGEAWFKIDQKKEESEPKTEIEAEKKEGICISGEHQDGTGLLKLFEFDREKRIINEIELGDDSGLLLNNLFGNIFEKKEN